MADSLKTPETPIETSISKPIGRRTFLGRLVGAGAAGLLALSGTRSANAQNLKDLQKEGEEISRLMALAREKTIIARQLLYTPPGETPPEIGIRYVPESETAISVTSGGRDLKDGEISKTTQNAQLNLVYSLKNSEPDKRTSLEICKALGELVWDSNRELLERNFYQIVDKNLGINFDQISLNKADTNQMATLVEFGKLVDFASYEADMPSKEIYSRRQRTLLPKELFARIYSIWLNESSQLGHKLADKPEMTNTFVDSLQLIFKLAPQDASFHSFGIDKNNVLNIIKRSNHPASYIPLTKRTA